ncbi:MAG: cellulase-like family protein [Candidatus Latescibacterota bacterium]
MAPASEERLAISFWIWALWDTTPNGFFHDLEARVAELVERGFNGIRLEGGACLAHDAAGRPRGALEYLEAVPGHAGHIRQMERMGAGRCDVLGRLVELCTLAQRYRVKVILSSWYFLHTFWVTDDRLTAELLGLPPERCYMRFAEGLHHILQELEQRGLADVVAFAEVFNESDGLSFVGGFGEKRAPKGVLNTYRSWHEEALAFLQERHPDIRFALDTYTPHTNAELAPRNAQVWNFHSYFLWGVYGVLEQCLWSAADLNDPACYAPLRRYLRRDVVPLRTIQDSRRGRAPMAADWYKRIWLYRNLHPAALPEVEGLLQANLEQHAAEYARQAEAGLTQALAFRDRQLPGVPLVMGEGMSYCGDNRLRWEERSDLYWEIVERAVRQCRDSGVMGCVARTNSGPEDPAWWEYPERLQRVNTVFLGRDQ